MKSIFSLILYFSFTLSSFSQQWQMVGDGLGEYGSVIINHNNELYIAANNLVLKWNGTDYDTLGKRFDNRINDLEFYNGELYAAGGFRWYNYNQGGPAMNQIAKWNGTDWENVSTGLNGTSLSLQVYNNKLHVTGNFTTAGGVSVNHIAAWNGSSWEALGSGVNYWEAILTVFNNELYVLGSFSMAGGISVNNAAKWNGTAWSTAGNLYGGGRGKDTEVFMNELFLSDGYISAIEGAGNLYYPIVKWNNASWSFAGDPGGDPNCLMMDVYNNNLYSIKKQTGGSMFVYNNSTWEPVSFPTNGLDTAFIYQTIVIDGDLYIVGEVYFSPGINVGIAKISLSSLVNNLSNISSSLKSIEVYPNPAKDIIHFNSLSPTVQKVDLYNMSGILIHSYLSGESINIAMLSSGVYLLKVISEEEVRIAKFIKE